MILSDLCTNIAYICLYFRAVVFISHGVSEHSGRHHKLAVLLQDNQFAVYAHDHGMNACS